MSKILIADDEDAIRMLYGEELEDEGYYVITVGTAHKILDIIEKEQPDLVILDIKLSESDGLDVLQGIRNRFYYTPVILCTAYSDYHYDPRAIAADAYVIKATDLSELKKNVKASIRNKIDIDAITKRTPLEDIKNILKRLLNYQPEFVPIPDKIPAYFSLIKDLEKKDYFKLCTKEKLDMFFKALCIDFYAENRKTSEIARDWLISHNTWEAGAFLASSYEKACPQHMLTHRRFEWQFAKVKRNLKAQVSTLHDYLTEAKKNIEEGYLSKVPIDELKKVFLSGSHQTISHKMLIKYLKQTIKNIEDKSLSKVPLHELSNAFSSARSQPREKQDLSNIVLRDLRHDFKAKLSKMLIYLDGLRRDYSKPSDLQKPQNEALIPEPFQKLFETHSELSSVYQRLKNICFFEIISHVELVDVKKLLKKVLSGMTPMDKKAMKVHYGRYACKTITDPNLLSVALNQVIQNAVDAIDLEGSVAIHIVPQKAQKIVTFIVADNGPGIPSDIISEVFKLNFTYRKSGHSGVGLTLANAAIREIRGSIKLDTEVGRGTKVKITIPWEN